jgi:adenylate cyclase
MDRLDQSMRATATEAGSPHQSLEPVTFLFADLAGFTALTEAHGDLDAVAVASRFFALARATLIGDARLVKTIGDAVMIAVGQPKLAVAMALRLLAAIEAEPAFPTVRIGLHRGPAVELAGDYFGATVNLAARVASYSRPGQILCTEPVATAVQGLESVVLRAIGQVSLKNVTQVVTLFELEPCHRTDEPSEIDVVCRMRLEPAQAAAQQAFAGRLYFFCSTACAQAFAQQPELYIHE